MTLKIQKKDGPLFAADLEQLKAIASKPTKQKVVLGGQLFLCSMEPIRLSNEVVQQAPRPAARKKPWDRKPSTVLNLALDKEAVNMLVRARIKPVFAIDALLRYGQKLARTEDALLINATSGTSSTFVNVLHFKKGVLVSFNEYVLSHPSAHTYDADLHVLLERLRINHLSAVFHWCGPLSMPRSQTFIVAHPQVWQLAPIQAVTRSGRAKFFPRYGLALGLTVLSIGGYAGALFIPYQSYQKAANELARESSQLKGEYTFASERLALLEARREFFKNSGKTSSRLQQFQSVLSALTNVEGLVLKDAAVATTAGASLTGGQSSTPGAYVPDFELIVEVPKDDTVTALEQSQPLLKKLSETLGMNLRLAIVDGFRDVTVSGDKSAKRAYRIQGEFNRAP